MVTVRFVAPGKIDPGGERTLAIAACLAAGKMVAEGDYSMEIVTSLASGKL